jgi:hypothetical protein
MQGREKNDETGQKKQVVCFHDVSVGWLQWAGCSGWDWKIAVN